MTTSIAPPRARTGTTIELPQQLTSRPRLVERIAMRMAVWLLIWSTRPQTDPEAEHLQNQQYLERERREAAWVRIALQDRAIF